MSFFTDLTNLSSITWPNLTGLKLALPNLATLDLIAIGAILFALCFWLISKQSDARLKRTLASESDKSLYESQFKCVVFAAGDGACNKALKFETTPILLKNAPKLPLPGCGAANCTCGLFKHDDRRTGIDRRSLEVIEKGKKSVYADKRQLKDRRRDSIREFLLPQYRSFG